MLYTYNQCMKVFGSDFLLKKANKVNKIFKIEEGVYSTEEYVPELAVICLKYPNSILTLNSAFYYHGLTDVIPDYYYLKTNNNGTLKDTRIKQFHENSKGFTLEITKMEYTDVDIKIYNKERMLIELIRNKNKLSFDFYKEVLLNYRKIAYELDIQMIQEYISQLPKKNMILETIQLEVF